MVDFKPLGEFFAEFDVISKERHNELLVAAHDGNALKNVIHEKAKEYGSLSCEEIRLLDNLYFKNESGENKNGSK
ncbi:MAG: hypothetical protein E7391_06355 [Ruminococcaceae bacterium]|nr:hypothetical protein [Oscillospiraceae bacterium]